MLTQQELSRVALRAAFDMRRKVCVRNEDPICIYDFAAKLGVDVWFLPGSSFAGIYAKDYNKVFVPVERPAGRKAFTCAHELAHFWFGHGTVLDELDFDRADSTLPEERLANRCAAYLLMPSRAVMTEFSRRGLKPKNSSATDFYRVASQFGVGYETLVTHLRWSLNIISHSQMEDLKAIPPKELRRAILGGLKSTHLVYADDFWHKVAIDLEVDDFAFLPPNASLRGLAAKVVGKTLFGTIIQ
jgi:Zn-dependent peptidase ImmA (M78 family)